MIIIYVVVIADVAIIDWTSNINLMIISMRISVCLFVYVSKI